MTEYAPAGNRTDALFRILLLAIWTWTIWPIVLTIGLIGGVVFFVLDVILQLIRGDPGLMGGTISTWSQRLFAWPLGQLEYIIGTEPQFPILP